MTRTSELSRCLTYDHEYYFTVMNQYDWHTWSRITVSVDSPELNGHWIRHLTAIWLNLPRNDELYAYDEEG